MRIIVSATLGGGSAGTWYAVETARRLAQRGHEIRYLSRPGRSALARAQAAGLSVVDDIDLEEKSPLRANRNLRRLTSLARQFRPDVILAHGGEDHAFWGVVKALRARHVVLIRVRALDPKLPRRHMLSRWLHKRATDVIVTVNSRHYAAYQSRLKIPPDRLRIIEAGVEPADFADVSDAAHAANAIELPAGKQIVVMVARFAPIKGHRVLLTAAARIKRIRDDVHHLWIGYPQAYTAEALHRRLVEANLTNDVTIIDRRLPALPALLAHCQLGVVASIGSESLSRSLLEYLASGLPVAATSVGGIPDLMARGDFGRLMPPDNPEALAQAILGLLGDTERRQACGRRGREYVLSHCTWDQRVDQWEELLVQAVAARGGSARS
ncbi:MAG: glycosyltransferase family 4 protein [Candidatus Zixiibacteriota bacterium]